MKRKLISIIDQAGSFILKHYNQELHTITKEDRSPVTIADIESHNFITSELKRLFSYPVYSEEAEIPYEERKQWPTYWLLDPLDGTKDFIAKNDDFCISLALIADKKPIIGLIYAPVSRELHYAEAGLGIEYYKSGKKMDFSYQTTQRVVAAISRFHNTKETLFFLERNNIQQKKTIGSALKFIHLAQGKVQIYPRFQYSKEWDIAAGHLILQEAGGWITDLKTLTSPVYNKENVQNNFFIAGSRNFNLKKLIY